MIGSEMLPYCCSEQTDALNNEKMKNEIANIYEQILKLENAGANPMRLGKVREALENLETYENTKEAVADLESAGYKVYGLTDYKGRRIVAAKSKAAAARIMGVSTSEFKNHACETGNGNEILAGHENPGQLIWMNKK